MRPTTFPVRTFLLAASLALFHTLLAQTPTPADQLPDVTPTTDAQPYTLHVYRTLLQVPTLLISNDDSSKLPPLTLKDFSISLDRGPDFKPSSMRLEGDDPIALAVLLDNGGEQADLLKNFSAAFSQLVPSRLHPNDRISLYAIDCTVIRALDEAAPNAASLQSHIDAVLADNSLHGGKPKPACRNKLQLWDAIAIISDKLTNLPSRRVLLVLSEGRDGSSKRTEGQAAITASTDGVAVFTIRDRLVHDAARAMEDAINSHGMSSSTGDGLYAMTTRNGGNLYNIVAAELPDTLQAFLDDVRGRYILEFSESLTHATAGLHEIVIKVDRDRTSARTAGVTAALPDPTNLADPNTIPTTSGPAVYGTHHSSQ